LKATFLVQNAQRMLLFSLHNNQLQVVKTACGFLFGGNDMNKLKVAAYCRVITNHEEQESSLEAQVSYYES